jgi:hypothetical protein
MIRNETEVLNLKTRNTQVPLGYLTLIFLFIFTHHNYLGTLFKHNLPILVRLISYLSTILSF